MSLASSKQTAPEQRSVRQEAAGERAAHVPGERVGQERKQAEEVLSDLLVEELQRKKSRSRTDLTVLLPSGILLLALLFYFEIFDVFEGWILLRYTFIDEIVGVAVFLAFAFAIFTYRRWQDTKEQIVGRKKAEEALRALHAGLEIQVQGRTSDLAKSNESLRNEIARRRRVEQEIQRHLDRSRALHEIDVAITSLDLRGILEVLLEKIEIFLPYRAVTTIRLLNRESGVLESLACRGLNEEEWRAQESRIVGRRARKIVETKTSLTVRNVPTDPQTTNPEFFRKNGLVSHLGVPLIAKDEAIGVLGVYTREEHEFSREEIDFLTTLAGRAAIAIHNARLYDDLKASRDNLEKANNVKEEFLSMMSHELRTPLSVVMGYTGLVKDGTLGPVNEQQRNALQKVLGRAGDQLEMINEIMQTTQLDARAVSVSRDCFDLRDLLDQLRSDYEVRAQKKNVRLIWHYPDACMPAASDAAKLKQILQNLINNAFKFTDAGNVTVSARVLEGKGRDSTGSRLILRQAQDDPERIRRVMPHASKWVEFVVSDTGIGISKEMQGAIFNKFHQVGRSDTRLYGGVGLGLYIVKNFTELLGGQIEVQSEVGKGSTFTVTVPVEQ